MTAPEDLVRGSERGLAGSFGIRPEIPIDLSSAQGGFASRRAFVLRTLNALVCELIWTRLRLPPRKQLNRRPAACHF